jgi:Putative auto-transporter adhesin, head GIN domain
MKKIVLFLFASVFTLVHAYAQQEINEANAQKRSVGTFHSIDVSSGIEVILTKGDKEELVVSVGDLAYRDQVKTTVSNGVLKITRDIDWKFWNTWKNWSVRAYVSYTNLDRMTASSGSIIKGKELTLSNLTARASSGAQIQLSGKAEFLDVDVSSGSSFRGNDFSVTKCKAEASSGAGVTITVEKELSAEASSGGNIKYKGNGSIRDINISSGGSVKRQY